MTKYSSAAYKTDTCNNLSGNTSSITRSKFITRNRNFRKTID